MIRGVIFDCFGVLCQGSLEHFVSQAPTDEIRQKVLDANRAADYGYISHDDYILAVAEALGRDVGEIAEIASKFQVQNAPMVELARSLKRSYKIALLSNMHDRTLGTIFSLDERAALFDVVILSCEVGMIKPDTNIFELTASRLSLLPEQCVMVDDLPRNIEGAQAAGMNGVVYSSPRQVQSELARLSKENA